MILVKGKLNFIIVELRQLQDKGVGMDVVSIFARGIDYPLRAQVMTEREEINMYKSTI